MAITQTAKGTTSSKTSGTTLILSSIAVNAYDILLIAVAGKCNYTIPVSAKWGDQDIWSHAHIANISAEMNLDIFSYRPCVDGTENIVITWGSSIEARAMIALISCEAAVLVCPVVSSYIASTTDPQTGVSAALAKTPVLSEGFFLSNGPSEDAVGTVGQGYTSGQRVGTTGGEATSNVTLHEVYKIANTAGNTLQISKIDATARVWTAVVAGWEDIGDMIALDMNGYEIRAGDKVMWSGSKYTVSSVERWRNVLVLTDGKCIGASQSEYTI